MRQRGRKGADLRSLNITGHSPRLTAPAGLTAKERRAFNSVIEATDPAHFRKSDIPLIVAFVQATILTHRLARDASKITEWEKATRVMAMLATKLRLSVQSRADAKTISRQQFDQAPMPWETKLEE